MEFNIAKNLSYSHPSTHRGSRLRGIRNMALLYLSFISLFLVQSHRATSHQNCNRDSVSCSGDGVAIEFPFGLKGMDNQNQSSRGGCSYPNFQLSCDKQRQTIATFPDSGDFVVKYINYEHQTIKVNDPGHCLPKRFLHEKASLSGSPFQLDRSTYNTYNLTFLRCPSNLTESYPLVIPCLNDPSDNNYSVIAIWPPIVPESCHVISSIFYPVSNMAMWPFWPDLTEDIQLTWSEPACGGCAASGQHCGFVRDTGLQVGCFPRPHSQGLSRSAKYGLSIGLGIPGLLCLIGLSCCMCNKVVRTLSAQHRRPSPSPSPSPSTEFPDTIALQPYRFVRGLDGQTIEKYPKTLVGESGRLPKPKDNTCPICLSEYQPKETLRTIPDCNHYFHAICINEWLKINTTSPTSALFPSSLSFYFIFLLVLLVHIPHPCIFSSNSPIHTCISSSSKIFEVNSTTVFYNK